jgi:hypothetical protein
MGTTINIAKGAKAGGVCLAEVSVAELEQVEGGCLPVCLPGWLRFLFPGPCCP